ncbi:hypothetical protein B0H16DRAFT_1428180 [Mycena metata]|uniref:DUF7330 domain-containing protein n=1 Tax=Mycena metata TaxID=1033252 RepID=A0AAD7MS34_9AGAR|nr:hypothetical protein B0H16DRAFT_1428180 [Mycena metata]
MLITPDSASTLNDVKPSLEPVVNRAQAVPEDSPPDYLDLASQSTASSLPPVPLIPDIVKPTNFLSIGRTNASIKGTYAIDPRLKIPAVLLSPLAEGETELTRPNARLQTSNAPIDAIFFIVEDSDHKQRIDIVLKTANGSIKASVHAPRTRAAINLRVETSNAPVVLRLPRSFCGPLTLRTRYASVSFSDALSANLTTFNELDNTHRCFVGDFAAWGQQPDAWTGDELSVETTHGSIKLKYDVEVDTGNGKGKGKGGFFSRLFGGGNYDVEPAARAEGTGGSVAR